MDNIQQLNEFKIPVNFRGKSAWYVQFWWIIQSVFLTQHPNFFGWRRFLLRLFGAEIGKNVLIRPSVHIQFPWKLKVGDNSWIGDDVVLYSLGEIVIGSNVVISQRGYLCTGSHDYLSSDFSIVTKPIYIEDKCWLATDVYVAPGVTIGAGTVIGARSSVIKSLPSNKICLGNPAQPVKNRVT